MKKTRSVFTVDGRRALKECAGANVLLAFDYDGTLAPIAGAPQHAALGPRTHALLRALARRYPVAVLSGRHESDITQRVDGTGVWIAAGHNARWLDGSRTAEDVREDVAAWYRRTQQELGHRDGIHVEPKEFALAVHYREAADLENARRQIAAALEPLGEARIVTGDCVVNVLPAGTLSKAAVLTRICRDFACDTALYAGDDEEDEEVFGCSGVPLLGIRVGEPGCTRAAFIVARQRDIDRLLTDLCALRGAARTRERGKRAVRGGQP